MMWWWWRIGMVGNSSRVEGRSTGSTTITSPKWNSRRRWEDGEDDGDHGHTWGVPCMCGIPCPDSTPQPPGNHTCTGER